MTPFKHAPRMLGIPENTTKAEPNHADPGKSKAGASCPVPSGIRKRVPMESASGSLEAVRKGLRIRMGRYPAEIAEGAEVYWEGGKGPTSEPFSTTALVN